VSDRADASTPLSASQPAHSPATDERLVRPGMRGGLYKPLSQSQIQNIHRTALDVLERVGFADAIPSGVEIMTRAGARQGENGRLTFPRALVEDTIAKAGRHFVLHGQDPRHDMEPWGDRVYFGTAGAAVHMVDARTGDYRESTAKDLYDIARIVDALEHVHFFLRSVVCRDIADPYEMDVNTCYAAVSGTAKPVGSSWSDPRQLETSLEMLHMIAGGEAQWRRRPFVSQANCFVVPPLKFAPDSCRCLEVAVRAGMPVFLVSAGQAGATAPAALAGSLVLEMAECLAALVYVNAIVPGAPAIFGPYCFVSDLRSGAMSGGSPEQALLSAAAAQMAQFYDLTCGTPSGMTDSKIPDAQAGYEKAYNHALVGNAGANLIYESAGMMASLLGFSLEQLVIDNDIVGAVQRTIRGIDVDEEALCLEAIREVCLEGPGHFRGSAQTRSLTQSEYLYPDLADRESPQAWIEQGSTSIVDRAERRVAEILSSHFPAHVDAALDGHIRARMPIRLSRAAMLPAQRIRS
jgi:trimethylamine--corrinoid protein Co-methyltransferase